MLKHGENIKNHYKDFGSDNKHSGPLTHAWYCDLIYNKIKEDKIIPANFDDLIFNVEDNSDDDDSPDFF